jgi:hypothetical protein
MSTCGIRSLLLKGLLLAVATLFQGCGGRNGIEAELAMVPGTYLLHIHAGGELAGDVIELARRYFPQTVLAARMLEEGPLGVSVVSVDITTMTPQFLLLSRDVGVREAVEMAVATLDVTPDTLESRIDFVTGRGQVRGSVASRDGWTCVYLGSAPSIVVRQWLELEEGASLAADSALVSVIPDGHDLTVLVSGNLIGFVSLLPLDRWVPGWDMIGGVISAVGPAALGLGISWKDSAGSASVEVIAARRGGAVSRVSLEVSDTVVTTDMVWPLVESALGLRTR